MFQYWLTAIGFLCTAINLEINGLGILLPTCVGYALIAVGAWGLREIQPISWGLFLAASVMATITVPLLFRGFTTDGYGIYDQVIYWIGLLLDLFIYGVFAVVIFHEASIYGSKGMQLASILVAPIAVACIVIWWLMPIPDNATLILSFLIYSTPMFYLSGLSFAAAKSL